MIQDFRFAFRQLWKARGFTAAAIVVLALGIGANSAVFSLVDALLFRSPGYAQPEQIVQVFSQDRKNPKTFRSFSYPTFRDIREGNTVFTDVMAYNLAMVGIGEKENTRRTFASVVSSNYFAVLGVAPVLGRAFLPEEENPGANAQVAIVSHGYWKRNGGSAGVLGSKIVINGRPHSVVGVMPEGFTGTMHIFGSEVWVPLSVYDQVANEFNAQGSQSLGDRAGRHLNVVGRLKPAITAASAEPALRQLAANLEQAFPAEQKDQTFIAGPLPRFDNSASPSDDDTALAAFGTLIIAMAAVVLVVACLNLAAMLLARSASRRKEMAIRQALGARRSRIIRQLLTEALVLALLGGAFGMLLALWSSDLLIASLGPLLPFDIAWESGPNLTSLAVTVGFCILATFAFAFGPALRLSRADAIEHLKQHPGEDVTQRRWKFLPRNPLVAVQIACSLALLTAAFLFMRGAGKAASIETGLQPGNSFLVELDASLSGYDRARARQLYSALEERFAALPGVENASISATVPFGMVRLGRRVELPGAAESQPLRVSFNSVGDRYFSTVGLPLLRGRPFSAAEATQAGGPPVAIIDDVLAKKLWPNGDALGQHLQLAGERKVNSSGDISPGEPIEVIGIVPTVRAAVFEKQQPSGAMYLPFARGFQINTFIYVRFKPGAHGSSSATAELLRRTVREIDPALPVLSLKTIAQHLNDNLELWMVRAAAALFTVFGVLALGLSVIGLYGVKAYSVARRTREIGIRMALGAQRAAVQRMILGEGAALLAGGIAFGLLLAAATGIVVSSMLYEVSPIDPIAFTIAPLVLAAAGMLATWIPARRATRINPMTALRTE
jgi:predicted permease